MKALCWLCFLFTAYYIAFGPHGPRRPPPPDEGRNVFLLSSAVIAGAIAIFAMTRMFANPVRPRTMTKEWQEASEEYLKVRNFAILRASIRLWRYWHFAVSRKWAHYWLQGNADPEQVWEGRAN